MEESPGCAEGGPWVMVNEFAKGDGDGKADAIINVVRHPECLTGQ